MSPGDVRTSLRQETRDVHERLHGHPAFAVLMGDAPDLAGYRQLLSSLWGFHSALERHLSAVTWAPPAIHLAGRFRSPSLRADLNWLGLDDRAIDRLPVCALLPRTDTVPHLLGCLYVTEGSTLGGRQLASRLDGLLGREQADGRRFLLGHGSAQGAMWRSLLAEVEGCTGDEPRRAVRESAQETFMTFERWMSERTAALA